MVPGGGEMGECQTSTEGVVYSYRRHITFYSDMRELRCATKCKTSGGHDGLQWC